MHLVLIITCFVIFHHSRAVNSLWQQQIVLVNSSISSPCQCGSDALYFVCQTLNEALDLVNECPRSSNIVRVVSPIVNLTKHVHVENTSDLLIQGESHSNVSCNCSDDTCKFGLIFTMVYNLKIINLTFDGCGTTNKVSNYSRQSAIAIRDSESVLIQHVRIKNSKGNGLTLINVQGEIYIHETTFTNNVFPKSKHNDTLDVGGGGLYIYLNRCGNKTYYQIHNCSFHENQVSFNKRSNYSGYKVIGKGHGGGLVIILHKVKNISIEVNESKFVGNNATFGGGAAVMINSDVMDVVVIFYECSFKHNKAQHSIISNGGGLQVMINGGSSNSIVVYQTKFLNNKAYFGGGASIASGHGKNESGIFFINSTWIKNTANTGAAVDVSPLFTDKHIFQSVLTSLYFIDCNFRENRVEYHQNKKTVQESLGNGIMFVSLMEVCFVSSVHFENNTGTALKGVQTTIHFSCPKGANFINNVGINGGAISLQGFARLNIMNFTRMYFINNHAKAHGGALHSEFSTDHMLFTHAACPFILDDHFGVWFINNTANKTGSSMYFSSLLPCQLALSKKSEHYFEPSKIFKNLHNFTFQPNSTNKRHIATAPSHYKLSENITVNPGEVTKLGLDLMDDLNNPVNDTILQLFTDTTGNSPLSQNQDVKCVSGNKLSLSGNQNKSGQILLKTLEKPLLSIMFNAKTNYCPPGYRWQHTSQTCACMSHQFYGIKHCTDTNLGNFSTYTYPGVWIGYLKNGDNHEFVSGLCYWFCRYNSTQMIPRHTYGENKELYDVTCYETHTGVLCGKCKENYTIYYHDPGYHCESNENCSLGWFYFILSEIVPITILVAFVMTTDLNIASGYVQGFLLYSHTLVLLTFSVRRLTGEFEFFKKAFYYFMRIFYDPLDLKFFLIPHLSFCLLKKATALDIVSLAYLSTAFSFALIFVVVAFMKCFAGRCHCFNRWIRFTTAKNSAIRGLSALFLLSYTACVETSLLILQPVTLYGYKYSVKSYRVALYGDMVYFSREHLKYAIPAIISLILIVTPSMMLFLYPIANKVLAVFELEPQNSKTARVLSYIFMYNKLKPFYDIFYSSFQDDYRYFAGLYLIYRLLISLPYFLPSKIVTHFIMELILILFLALHAIVQPYNKKQHNVIDALLLSDLVLVNGLTCANAVTVQTTNTFWKVEYAALAQIAFISIPMFIVLGHVSLKYILRPFWNYIHGRNGYQSLELINDNDYDLLSDDRRKSLCNSSTSNY